MENTNWNSTLDALPEKWKSTFGILMSMLSVISTIENTFVAGVICRFSVLQTPSNIILASLAISHLLIGNIAAPLHAVQLLNDAVINLYVVDVIRQYITTALIGVCTLTLGFITSDRCLHMVNLRNYKTSYISVFCTLSFCWLVPVMIPLLRNIGNYENMNSMVIIIFGTMILGTINCSYIALLYSLRKLISKCKKEKEMDRSYVRNERRAGITVFLVITLHTALLIPILVHYALCSLKTYDEVTIAKSYIIGMFSAIASSVVTPIIYISRTPPLRMYIRELFRFGRCRKYSTYDSYLADNSLNTNL